MGGSKLHRAAFGLRDQASAVEKQGHPSHWEAEETGRGLGGAEGAVRASRAHRRWEKPSLIATGMRPMLPQSESTLGLQL